MIGNFKQPKKIDIETDLVLVKYYPYYSRTLEWYQDLEVCKQVDNIDHAYDLDNLRRMYNYLSKNGECYYIKYKDIDGWHLIGDISLYNNEIAIVICREYQNRHIGRKAINGLLNRARELGIGTVGANIYSFNKQSQKAFFSIGFKKVDEERYILDLA